MALKIRCTDCGRKISIDEAFAGGMCRCPYCKALVYVEERAEAAASGARPAAPSARPAAPGERPAGPAAGPAPGPAVPAPAAATAAAGAAAAAEAADAHEHVPMARPVFIQGIITMILLGLVILIVAAGIVVAVFFIPGRDGQAPLPPPLPPAPVPGQVSTAGPGVLDVPLPAGPVIYCLDGGSGMRQAYDAAAVTIDKSIISLTEKGQFSILRCQEAEDVFFSPTNYVKGGEGGKDAVKDFLHLYQPLGATDLVRGLGAALARKPAAIVLLTRKSVEGAMDLANKAKQQGVRIITIGVDAYPDAERSLSELSKATGGEYRSISSWGG